jgi:hypothetical protein
MTIDISETLNQKFGLFEVDIPALEISENYLIFGDGEVEGHILEDLMRVGKQNFLGFIKIFDENQPSSTLLPEATRYSMEQAFIALEKGSHLIVSSGKMPDLLKYSNIDFLAAQKELLHLAKLWRANQFLPAKDNPYKLKCMNQRLYTSWLTDLMIKGEVKYCAQTLDLFFDIHELPNTTPEERRSILAKEIYTDLPSGLIASIYLAAGNFEKGWLYYQDAIRTSTERECAKLPHPYWTGESFANKKVVFRREPGPGDEILYSSIFNDVTENGCEAIIEVDPRLQKIFQRSFPKTTVIPRDETNTLPQLLEPDIDFQASYSDPFCQYRDNLQKFKDHDGYLLADEKLTNDWKSRIDKLFPEGINIGISWCSSSFGVFEDAMSTHLRDWIPLLSIPNINFINLQYGDIQSDLMQVGGHLNITIHELAEIDLFNDFDDLAAIIKNLDLVISVNNITAHLAGAIGTPLWHICPLYWFQLCGQDYDLFRPRARLFDLTDKALSKIAGEFSNIILEFEKTDNSKASFQNLVQRKTE